HQFGQQLLVERSPVHADTDRLSVFDRALDDRAEVLVATLGADVAGVDAVLREGTCRIRELAKQQVPVVVEVADDRHVDVLLFEQADQLGNGCGGFIVVDGHADQLAAGGGECCDLCGRGPRVGGVRVRHRLHDDWMAAADIHAADIDGDRAPSRDAGARFLILRQHTQSVPAAHACAISSSIVASVAVRAPARIISSSARATSPGCTSMPRTASSRRTVSMSWRSASSTVARTQYSVARPPTYSVSTPVSRNRSPTAVPFASVASKAEWPSAVGLVPLVTTAASVGSARSGWKAAPSVSRTQWGGQGPPPPWKWLVSGGCQSRDAKTGKPRAAKRPM